MPTFIIAHPLFPLGQIVATPGALTALQNAGQYAEIFLARHAQGDWGDLCAPDRQENQLSLREGFRLFSAYTLETGQKL